MMKTCILFLTGLALFSVSFYAQNSRMDKMDVNGYVSVMPSVMYYEIETGPAMAATDTLLFEALLHNRLNFSWYPSSDFTASVQFRNRLIYGDYVENMPDYKNDLDNTDNFIDMSFNLVSGGSYILNSSIDRAWVKYSLGKLDITAGRQRINWSRTFAWNPNDLFNVYNFFDFDYPERPGSDAVRLQYYTGMTSSAEFAVKLDSAGKVTAAAKYLFSAGGTDIQILGGYYSSYSTINDNVTYSGDYVLGMGWAGYIKNVGLRGEMSYFQPKTNFADTSGLFYASISLDYLFSNDLSVNAEFFYSDIPDSRSSAGFMEFYSGPLSVKNLTFTRFNFFARGSYPLTPLFNVTLGSMIFFDNKDNQQITGFYIGPGADYNLSNSLALSLHGQIFGFEIEDKISGTSLEQQADLVFLRLKWNF